MVTRYNTGDTIYVPVRVEAAMNYDGKIAYRVRIPGEKEMLNEVVPEEYVLDPIEKIAMELPDGYFDDIKCKESSASNDQCTDYNSLRLATISFLIAVIGAAVSISALIIQLI